jgi:type IV pilus assembly protein PilN
MILGVNLATQPLETHRRFRAFSAAVGAVAAAVFFCLAWQVYSLRKAEASFHLESATVHRKLEALTAQREELDRFFVVPENAELHDRATFINSIIDARSFNWTHMFMDLEKVLPIGVHVISIEPKQVNGQASVKLTFGTASDAGRIKFLHALEQSTAFSHLQLVRVRAPTQQASGDQEIIELTVVYSRA